MFHDTSLPKSTVKQMATVVLFESLAIALCLFIVLISYSILNNSFQFAVTVVVACTTFYLGCLVICSQKGFTATTVWGLILFYELLATTVLIHLGFSSIISLFAISFILLLSGPLLEPRHILFIGLLTLFFVILAYIACSLNMQSVLSRRTFSEPSLSEFITVFAVLAVFTFVSWLSSYLSHQYLSIAINAEKTVRQQKNLLIKALENKSMNLRRSQLEHMEQLYQFAIIGQSAAASLHELSNHLNVLGLDIIDLKEKHRHTQSIENAEESIKHMNNIVHTVRKSLAARGESEVFDILPPILNAIRDLRYVSQRTGVTISHQLPPNHVNFRVFGNPVSLTQVVTILLKNAVEACLQSHHPSVQLIVTGTKKTISIIIQDNGPGVHQSMQDTLFLPKRSSKTTGLGVGLYIAKQLIESQFNGSLSLAPSHKGACFEILLKRV